MHGTISTRSPFPATVACLAIAWSSVATADSLPPPDGVGHVPIHGALNAMRELCYLYESDGPVAVSFSSAYPVDFNIHRHHDTGTSFPIEVTARTRYAGRFVAKAGNEYCYTWTNSLQRDAEWEIEFVQRPGASE